MHICEHTIIHCEHGLADCVLLIYGVQKKNEVSDFEENVKTPRSIFLNLFWLNSLYEFDGKKH